MVRGADPTGAVGGCVEWVLGIRDKGGQMSEVDKAVGSEEELWGWVREHLGMEVPRRAFCEGHSAPFEYLSHAYFEPAEDVVVWGPRGGGKTRLAAAATLLDLLHKPGITVRVLGGSLEQSLRVWEHFLPDVEKLGAGRLAEARSRARRVQFEDGASAAVLTQSQRAVRGQRVQKMRCDEVELFDPAVWEAVAATTRSMKLPGGGSAAGVVEAFSTHHQGYGLMEKVLDRARANGTKIIKWCILDVMAKCEPERECGTCGLLTECGGRAKTEAHGFVPVDDVLRIKRRMSVESWETEMLCKRPSREGRVFPRFSRETHVRAFAPGEIPGLVLSLGVDFGFAAPFVALWVGRGESGMVYVADEYVVKEKAVEEHHRALKAHALPATLIRCDPAGNGRNEQTTKSTIKVLRELGWTVQSRRSEIYEGIERLRVLICPGSGRVEDSKLVVHPRCKKLIAALEQYHYPPVNRDELPKKDGVHDHLIDALRYWLVNEVTMGTGHRSY